MKLRTTTKMLLGTSALVLALGAGYALAPGTTAAGIVRVDDTPTLVIPTATAAPTPHGDPALDEGSVANLTHHRPTPVITPDAPAPDPGPPAPVADVPAPPPGATHAPKASCD